MTYDEIAESLHNIGPVGLVTISGGNPCVHPNVDALIRSIKRVAPEATFSVETQGSIWQTWVKDLDYCVVSPKGPSSGMTDKTKMNVLDKFMWETRHPFLKVVVFSLSDLDWARYLHKRYPLVPFYISSGTNEPYTGLDDLGDNYQHVCEWVTADSAFQNAVVLPQLHKIAWGIEKGR